MIEFVTGNPGDGKSYAAVRTIATGLKEGKCVGTNLPLVTNFPERVARKHLLLSSLRRQSVERLADLYRRRLYESEDLSELLRIRVDAGDSKREELVYLVIDEAHENMNSRTWDLTAVEQGDGRSRRELAVEARLRIVREMATHRHKRLRVYLVTQNMGNVDSQIRVLQGCERKVRNLKRLPVWPLFNFFVAVTRLNDETRTRTSVSAYFLRKWIATSYDSWQRGRREYWPADAIVLPRPRGDAGRTRGDAGRWDPEGEPTAVPSPAVAGQARQLEPGDNAA
jgi:zona occludens toxin (predicted ATPase)